MESVAGKLEVQQSEKQINISITVAIFYHKIIFFSPFYFLLKTYMCINHKYQM